MNRRLVIESLKRPHRIPHYFWHRYIKKRVAFTRETVAGSELPVLHARLYKEVRLLEQAIGDFHANKSLEVGCGYGRLVPWIAEHSNQHFAIEAESTLLEDARKLYPASSFHHAKAQKMPFPDRYFDLCVCWTVLIHIPPTELPIVASEIKRVCKPKATIILCEGIGNLELDGVWHHTLDEWHALFSPYKMTLNLPFQHGVSVMRFE